MSRPTVVLASASPARLRLLRRTGLDPIVRVSHVDEEAAVAAAATSRGHQLSVSEQALLLAILKVDEVFAQSDLAGPAIFIGCDTTLELDGEAHNKPSDADDVRRRWKQMSGQRGHLHTGHSVIARYEDGTTRRIDTVRTAIVHFGNPDDDEINDYVATGEPLKVAGAFTLEGYGGAFIERIEGDPSCIEGLSLPMLRSMCAELGYRWTNLWTTTSSED